MILRLTGVDVNRSEILIDSDDIDYVEAGLIQGSTVATKNQNYFDVIETPTKIAGIMGVDL